MKQVNKQWLLRPLLLVLALSLFVLPVAGATVTYEDGNLVSATTDSSAEDDSSDGAGEEDDWGNWEDWIDNDMEMSSEVELSTEFTPQLVCENDTYTFWYDTTGADVYVRDKRDGHIWSSAVDSAYYENEDASASMLSQLVQVNTCDEDGGISVWQLCDAVGNAGQFTLNPVYDETGMTLSVDVTAAAVGFDLRFELTDKGLTVSVPAKTVRQGNGNRLSSLILMPCFGAARTDETGYILLPDGSGALVRFDGMEQQEDRVYTYSLYGQTQQDMDALLDREEQDIKNMMLPLVGIRSKNSGFMAAVTNGAENAYLNVVPHGYQAPKLGRAYYTMMYLYSESITINGQDMEQVMPLQELSDREVTYYLMDSKRCDYSDMAALWRAHLEETGVLTTRVTNTVSAVSLDLFMGVNKSGLFFDSMVNMTTFDQAKKIVSDLKKDGVTDLEITLQGWNDGGFTSTPTPANVSGALGGKGGLTSLTEWLKKEKVPTYLYNDYLGATTGSKTANLRRDVIRDYVSNMVMGGRDSQVMLNLYRVLNPSVTLARKAGLHDNAGFSLARVGQWLWNNYERGNENTRKQTVEACTAVLKDCRKTDGALQVYGGNQYVLPYATSLREIPDTNSGYYIAEEAVPFYQMVVSGYVRYTSIAGNMTYDLQYQKLRWVEYGCTPYFILSWENAINLVDSDYDRLFSSEYNVWGKQVKAIHEEFSTRLKALNGAAMIKHTAVGESVSKVDYDNGCSVYVNYGEEAVTVDGVSVPAREYAVVSAEGGVVS